MDHPASSWVAVARLLRPQGRRGELLAEPLTDQDEFLRPGQEFLSAAAGSSQPADPPRTWRLEDAWQPTGRNAGRWVLKLEGCDSIDQAEALVGLDLLLPLARLPQLEADTYFVRDLIGCELYDGERRVGTVAGVEFLTTSDGRRQPDAAPLLELQLGATSDAPPDVLPGQSPEPTAGKEASEAEPVLLPFAKAWLDAVDIPGRRIVMHLPKGLLDSLL